MTDLVVVTPSRGRPQNVARLWDAMQRTCRADTELVIGLDDDDPTLRDHPEGPTYVVESPTRLGRRIVAWLNHLAKPYLGRTLAVGHFGDDCLPRTDGWDEKVLDALLATPFAFGNDLSIERPPGSLCTHLFMRSGTCRSLGYFGPPSIQHMWVDLAWMAWGEALGMAYLHEVVIEHLHFLEGKAPYDASYQRSRQLVDQDLVALWFYVRDQLNTDLQKIKPGTPAVTPPEFSAATHRRGAPVPVPEQFLALVSG